MYVNIKNENYGYAVATYGDYVVVGNPGLVRYDELTSSLTWTGSVDIFRYNYKFDQHEYVGTLFKNNISNEILLLAETGSPTPPTSVTGSLPLDPLHTEVSGSTYTKDKDLILDIGNYISPLEDGYGRSIDAYNNILVVGCSYYSRQFQTSASSVSWSGSAVDVYNLNKYNLDEINTPPYSVGASVEIGTGSYTGYYRVYNSASLSGYDTVEVIFNDISSSISDFVLVKESFSVSGSFLEYYFHPDIFPLGTGSFQFRFSKKSDPYVLSIDNPDVSLTGSFGESVSINDGWIAVGSPNSGFGGAVYVYRNESPTNPYSWSYQQKITPSDTISGLLFGSTLELNKITGSKSGSLIVGVGSISSSKAFLYEYISGSWQETYVFTQDRVDYPLTFGNYLPYSASSSTSSRYGTTVSMYGDAVVIGAPTERVVKEYSSSYAYQQGAVYIYERCENISGTFFQLSFKSYGNEKTFKENKLGYSVGIYGNNVIAGCPKTGSYIPICQIESTLDQAHYCAPTLESTLNGQVMFIQKNTGSNEWEISNVYRNKKRYIYPYRLFGYSVDVGNKSMVVGAPMLLPGIDREIDVPTTSSNDTIIGDIMGKSYIYNFKNFSDSFHIGNVFYRNGKIVIMTSGSVFDGILFNPISTNGYEYDLSFKGEHTIFEKQIICDVAPGEFNVSTNPTAVMYETSSWDVNRNGIFDFQDLDVILSYMQYKNTKYYSSTITTNWSASVITEDDEMSLFNYYKSQYSLNNTETLISQSIAQFEFVDTNMADELDLNLDNRLDIGDLNILWKFFANRLTQDNYFSYINPLSRRKKFNEIIDYLDRKTKIKSTPTISSGFFDYERLSAADKTGSFLAPYVTTIGLYDGLDLVAVAKLGNPVKIIPDLPLNFIVKMDF